MASTSGRSRTIMSPSTTCCWTIVVFVGRQLAGLAQDMVGDADLPDVVEQSGDANGVDEVWLEAHPLGQEDAIARDVAGVALRVAVLGVDRKDQTLVDIEGACGMAPPRRARRRTGSRRRRWPWPPAGSGPSSSTARSPSRREPGTCRRPTLTVSGRRSEVSNWRAWSTRRSERARGPSSGRGSRSAGATIRNSSGP